ncbi:DUF3034 family protein [Halothiobacillus sp. DCM-1]|uniref:DUF3034 family protein n=1 Tax=Halothiobacillus sp. DCM-1 TaxID=3112558 RepID=UPI00324A4A07
MQSAQTIKDAQEPSRNLKKSAVWISVILGVALSGTGLAHADDLLGQGRFLATGGIQSLDGAAGGGINPWAVIAGYGTNEQINPTASFTNVTLPDFSVSQIGVSVGIFNRLELSYAYQTGTLGSNVFNKNGTVALPLDGMKIGQHVFGAKVRLFGDAVYNSNNFIPQVALGVEYKKADTDSNALVPALQSLGAGVKDHGTDVYLSATKVLIGGFFGYNWLLNGNLRYTKANETGLLGFGGVNHNSGHLKPEFSTAVLLRPDVAVGYEYKGISNNLSDAGLKQSSWQDVFVAYFPNKNVSLALAFAKLGNVGPYTNQNGIYANATVSF